MKNLKILKQIIITSIQVDTAYVFNNWASISSIIFYMIANVVFINILFMNVNEIAGYSKDAVLLFNFMSQFWFFVLVSICFKNVDLLIQGVKTGTFDLILMKPTSSLFLSMFSNLSILGTFREGIPSLIILLIAINWNNLEIDPLNFLIGFLIAILGIAISIIVNFIVALPVFRTGDSTHFIDIYSTIEEGSGHSNLIFEIWNDFFKFFFTFIIPTTISTAISTSVILGKSDPFEMLFYSITVFIIFSIVLFSKNCYKDNLVN